MRVCGERGVHEGVWGEVCMRVRGERCLTKRYFQLTFFSLPNRGGSNEQRSSLRPLSLISWVLSDGLMAADLCTNTVCVCVCVTTCLVVQQGH